MGQHSYSYSWDFDDLEKHRHAVRLVNANNMAMAIKDFDNILRNAHKHDVVDTEANIGDRDRQDIKRSAYSVRLILREVLANAGCLCYLEDH